MKFLVVFALFVAAASARYTGPTTQAGVNLIKEFEGWYPNFYTDPVGIKTIGYGHACHVWNCAVPLNGVYYPPLTQAQGDALLKSDLAAAGRYEACVTSNAVFSGLTAAQYSALVSFTFNLGCGNLQSSTLLKMVNAGNIQGASLEFAKWVNAGGVVLPGLVRRREAERVLFCSEGGCSGGGGTTCTGTVTANSLIVRQSASTSAAQTGSLFNGDRVTIKNRVTGTSVSGNTHWFQLNNGYASAVFIRPDAGGPSWCAA
jgi:lysozyme